MNFDYDYPQETGNHEQTYALSLENADGRCSLSVIGSNTFAFSYHNFTLDNLTDSRHKNEMQKSEKNYLYVDYKMRGLGSRSCGPDPEEKYELHPHKFTFTFALAACDFNHALDMSRLDLGKKTAALSGTYEYRKPERIIQVADCDL